MPLDHRRRAGVCLEVAVLAAGAEPRAVVIVDDQVPQLRARAVLARDRQVADDDSAPHAGAQREHHHARKHLPAADPKLAKGRGARIVRVRDVKSARRRQRIANRKVPPPGQIAWRQQHAFGRIHRARRAQPEPGDLAAIDSGCAEHPRQGLGDAGDRRLRTASDLGGNGLPGQRCPLVVDDTQLNTGAAQVDAREKRGSGRIQRDRLPKLGHAAKVAVGRYPVVYPTD